MAKNLYDPITWLVGGAAGYGITTMGQMFARACARAGLHVFGYAEYPSLIRGGHNTAQVRIGTEKVHGHSDRLDVLIALNEETVRLHVDEMAEGGVVIYDGEIELPEGVRLLNVPLKQIVSDLDASKIMINTVALAASARLVGLPFEHIQSVIETSFGRKGQEVVDFNVKVAKAGWDFEDGKGFGKSVGDTITKEEVKKMMRNNISLWKDVKKQIVVSGNDAISLGAIKAGVKFMAAYPMTPVTSIMLNIAKNAQRYGIIMKQTEDEIAAVNMAIGASHMGVRAMTATSGGGFALMCEALGMAAMTETPLVLVEGTRPGPSTGLPTWTDQGDLRFVLHASQGEFPLVVALPGDVDECFHMTLKAFNLAEKYQMPCIVMTDKYLGESIQSTVPFDAGDYKIERGIMSMEEAEKLGDGEYLRFKVTKSGVSPRALPGYPNCIYTAATDEHAEDGDLDESAETRIAMVDKRARKLDTLRAGDLSEDEMIEVHGPAEADLMIVAWGSTKGPVLEALEVANEEGLRVNFLQIKYASPFPSEAVSRVLSKAKKVLLVENNHDAQMGGLVREMTGILIEDKLLRYDGRPVNAPEIYKKIKELL